MTLDEQRLRDLLVDAADDAWPAVGAVATAARQGRRLRLRRQIFTGTATAVVTGAVAIGTLTLTGSHSPGPVQPAGPTTHRGQPLSPEMRPVGRIQTLWQGRRNGEPSTFAAWFTAHNLLCVGEPVSGGYQNVSCGGDPADSPKGDSINGWSGTAAGLPNIDNGAHTWYLLSVGRTVAHVTVTLTTGAALPATLYLADGPQAQVLAVVLAPPHSTARQFTAYDAGGHQIDSARPQ